ncbi:FG-GAP-like repeat-containing protein [Singulisphaera rosea]
MSLPINTNRLIDGDRTITVKLRPWLDIDPFTFLHSSHFESNPLPDAIAAGDLNGDGKPDLVSGSSDSDILTVLTNTTVAGGTTPAFAPKEDFVASSGRGVTSVVIADMNGDGRLDLVATNQSAGTVSVLVNTSAAGATTPTFAPYFEFTAGASVESAAVGDLDADGLPDIALTNAISGQVSVLRNITTQGATVPEFAAKFDIAIPGRPRSIAIGDLNGDDLPDLAVTIPDSDVVSLLMNTTIQGNILSFAPGTDLTFPKDTGPYAVAIGDLNSDGKPDLAIANSTDWSANVLLNTTIAGASKPSFTRETTLNGTSFPSSIEIQDINGDGMPDLTIVGRDDLYVEVIQNSTTPGSTKAIFSTPQYYDVTYRPSAVAVADLNVDGWPDLALAETSAGKLGVSLQPPNSKSSIDRAIATGTIIDDDRPVSLAAASGDDQSVLYGSKYTSELTVLATNAAGQPVQRAIVTFNVPSTGASGMFADGSSTVSVMTDSDGRAVAPELIANAVAGSYEVTATVAGLDVSARFHLTNLKLNPGFSGLDSAEILYGTSSTTLKGHLAAGTKIPASGTVIVTINGKSSSGKVDEHGDFRVEFDSSSIPHSATPYPVTYTFTGFPLYNVVSDASTTLTVGSRSLVIYAAPRVKTYGESLKFLGTEFFATGLVNSDVVTRVALVSPGTAATASVTSIRGTTGESYAIIASGAQGKGLSNYSIRYVNSDLTVSPLHIRGTFTANDKSYDGTTVASVLTQSLEGSLGGVKLVGGTASFVDAGAGAGKTVTLIGASLSGLNAADYILDFVATARANILAVPSTIQLTSTGPIGLRGRESLLVANVMNGAVGSVTFYEGTKILGTGAISGTTATLLVRKPRIPGRGGFTASYEGDANHLASVSNAVPIRPRLIGRRHWPATPMVHARPFGYRQFASNDLAVSSPRRFPLELGHFRR